MSANTSRVNVNEIDAQFLDDVVHLLTDQVGSFWITCGNRDAATELAGYEAYLADPTHAPKYTNPANSAHVGSNFPDGCSRAVDLTLVRGRDDIWDVRDPAWQALLAAVKAHPRLHSLEDIGDYDHVELLGWRAATLNALERP